MTGMSISHEEARKLIQFKADDALNGIESSTLDTHLSACQECQTYAARIDDLKSTLQPLMHRRWNQHPLPHRTSRTVSQKTKQFTKSIFFATRIIAMGMICAAFLFNIWQFSRSGSQGADPHSAAIPMIPTPSLQSATTKAIDRACESISYEVRQGDTLESIADQFSVTAEDLRMGNNLGSTPLMPSMRLSVPVCSPTPSGTPSNARTTFTPLVDPATGTPVTGPTQ
jgi:hypothetical protein